MPVPIYNQKLQLRKRCHQIRRSLSDELRSQVSQAICASLEAWPTFQKSETILSYMPIKGEVDLTSLFERYPKKHWALPRILPGEEHRMAFHPYDSTRLVHHAFGMAEPDPDLPVIAKGEIELCLAPGLAFDRHGWRLGYGGGYFDRFLKGFSGTSVGVVYQELLLGAVPHSKFDIPMNWLVTETGLFQCQPTKV